MEKTKLSEMRQFKGFTQEQLADKLCIHPSNYSKRESGKVKMNIVEWEKLAKTLDVPLSEIYEADESQSFIFNDKVSSSFLGATNSTNNIYTVSEKLLETHEKYIKKLEEENAALKLQVGK